MAILLRHIWLLMTFRHTLQGLKPHRTSTLFIAMSLAVAASLARTGSVPMALFEAIFLAFIAGLASPRLAVACALVSIGIDGVMIPMEYLAGTIISVSELWEAAALVLIFWRWLSMQPKAR